MQVDGKVVVPVSSKLEISDVDLSPRAREALVYAQECALEQGGWGWWGRPTVLRSLAVCTLACGCFCARGWACVRLVRLVALCCVKRPTSYSALYVMTSLNTC